MSFWDFLRPPAPTKGKAAAPPPVTAETLRAALAEAEAAATAAEALAAEVAAERAGLLLGADDAQLDAIDRRLQLATREADRAQAAVEALRQKLAEAEERERQAGLDATYREGAEALAAGAALYRAYGEAAAEVAELFRDLEQAQATIEKANRALRAAGDPRVVQDLDESARPERSAIPLGRTPLWRQARLPAADHAYSMIWPPYVHPDVPRPPMRAPAEGALPAPPPRDPAVVY